MNETNEKALPQFRNCLHKRHKMSFALFYGERKKDSSELVVFDHGIVGTMVSRYFLIRFF